MKISERIVVTLAALAIAGAARAETKSAPKPLTLEQFPRFRTLDAPSGSALYRLDLPEEVYQAVAHDDLRDIRVFNAEGRAVPSSFQMKPTEEVHTTEERALSFFPIQGEETREYGAASEVVIQQGTGSVVVRYGGAAPVKKAATRGYLVDLREVTDTLRRIELDWEGPVENAFLTVRLSASDELTSGWRDLGGYTLARFTYAGEMLQQKAIELSDIRAKFLQLTWSGQKPLKLTAVRGELAKGTWIETKRHETLARSEAVENGDFLYTKSPVVADRIKIKLPTVNTLVRVEIDSRAEPKGPWSTRYAGLVYRVQQQGAEIASPLLKIHPTSDRYWRFHVVGKDASVGKDAPEIEFAWIAHQLFFLAQGNGPFKLAYGLPEAETPDFGFRSLSDTLTGESSAIAPTLATVGAEVKQFAVSRPPEPETAEAPWKQRALWASLVAAILVTSIMAWKLVRDMAKFG